MQDKRNFQGGLNRDDDSRVLPNGDYYYAQNIRVLSSEDRNTMLLENVRGMKKETYSERIANSVAGDYKVVGCYEDSPTNCLYYFVWHRNFFHLILEYNINTDLITTVYRDSGNVDNNALHFDKNTIITGINKIDDLLYWTCDNQYTTIRRTYHNEPKYINVERAKTGWARYYNNGSFGSNPSDYDIDSVYPFEFYLSYMDPGYANATGGTTTGKHLYLDVCKPRPIAPIYLYQTPIKNITSTAVQLGSGGLEMQGPPDPDNDNETETVASETVNPGAISYANVGMESLDATAEMDFAYKKNNLYGHMWQFACRFIYKDNEVSAYSDWSYVLPAPQYATNKVDESKQNAYNEVRVYYPNGPANVRSIEIVARKCSYIETSPDEGNKGEYYLIATVDNYYYDSSFTSATGDYNPLPQTYYGWSNTPTRNIPFITDLDTSGQVIGVSDFVNEEDTGGQTSVVGSSPVNSGFINFRNDGVYAQVDPVAFDKSFDQVPLRAKAQEIIGENRIVYGNYIDGFDQVNVHYHLSPVYGENSNNQQFVVDALATAETPNPWGSISGFTGEGATDELVGDGADFSSGGIHGTTSDQWGNFMSGLEYMTQYEGQEYSYPDYSTLDGWEGGKAFGWDANLARITVRVYFPTIVESGQVFHLKLESRIKYGAFNVFNGNGVKYPFGDATGSNISDHLKYDFFGYMIDIKKQAGGGGLGTMIDEFIADIKAMANWEQSDDGGGIPDLRGSNNPDSEFYNPNHAYLDNPINGGKQYTHWMTPATGTFAGATASYSFNAVQGAAPMRLRGIGKFDTSFGSQNGLCLVFGPYGQNLNDINTNSLCFIDDKVVYDDSHRLPDGTAVSNLHGWVLINGGTYVSSLECGGCTDGLGAASGWQSFDGSGGENNTQRGCSDNNGGWNDTGANAVTNVVNFGPYNKAGSSTSNMALINAGYPGNEDDGDEGSSFGPIQSGTSTAWSEVTGLNMPITQTMMDIDSTSAFKSGAWHRFGLVYYDYKGRSSSVMLNNEDLRDTLYDRNSSVYVGFPTERKFQQGADFSSFTNNVSTNNPSGLTNQSLTNSQKLGPADIHWKIFSRPPLYATHYQWVYARNTSIGKFMQFRVSTAWINKASKAGVSIAEGQVDTKIYISLDTMDGRDWSYSQRNRSLVGEWSFAEGDRLRLIADGNGTVFDKHYDLKVSDVANFPDRFELGGGDMEETQVVTESPVGGDGEDPQSTKPGKFVIIDDPGIPGYGVADADNTDNANTNGYISGWHKVTVEIYRPKKNTSEEQSVYYEFGERFSVQGALTDGRLHLGQTLNQEPEEFATYLGEDTSLTIPAAGVFRRGDIWYKPREVKYVGSGGVVVLPKVWVESYFLNDFLQTNHNNIARPHIYSGYAKEQRRKATITYSDVYQPDTQYNGLHSFNFSQRPYQDYDMSLGSIQKLVSRDTNLVLMQEKKISQVMINKSIITSPSGDQGISLSNNVLPEEATPFSGDYGVCTNPEAVAVHSKSIYFIDIKKGAVLRLGGDGITVISDYKMTDYFRDKMDLYQEIIESNYDLALDGGLFIYGGYDPRHGEYIVTFPAVYSSAASSTNNFFTPIFDGNSQAWQSITDTFNSFISIPQVWNSLDSDQQDFIVNGLLAKVVTTQAETVAFNEKSNRWSSFYTFYPEHYASLNRVFISFANGELYKHDSDSDNYCMFHGRSYPDEVKVSFPFNSDVSTVKTFNNIALEGPGRPYVIPLITSSANNAAPTVVATTDSANIEGSNVNFNENDIEIGDSLWYYDNDTLRTLGVITAITDADTIVTSVAEVNAFITASSTSSGDSLSEVFVITGENTAFKTDFETNINSTSIPHRLSYNNDDASKVTAGVWVDREQILGSHIPYGTTNSSGGEYIGLGNLQLISLGPQVTILPVGSNVIQTCGAVVGDTVYYSNNGVETSLGTIISIDNANQFTLSVTPSTMTVFGYIKKNATIEGDRLKGHYMDTTLTKRTKDKIHIYAANANVINSELSNK